MKVKIIADRSAHKGKVLEADYCETTAFPYRIKIDGLMTYWKDTEVEVIEEPIKQN